MINIVFDVFFIAEDTLSAMEDIVSTINERGLEIDIAGYSSGTYSSVYFAKKNDRKFAIKIYRHDLDVTDATILNEISSLSILSKYDHFPRISEIVRFNKGNNIFLVLEYVGQPLGKIILEGRNKLSLALEFLSIYQILYHNRITHGDIKIDNICIDSNGKLSLIDFGLSRNVPHISKSKEIFHLNKHIEFFTKDYQYNNQADIMSIFHMVAYLFNYHSGAESYHCYPLKIATEDYQLFNLMYLLLANKNNYNRRVQIWNMLKKLGCEHHFEDSFTFHTKFGRSIFNQDIYSKYQKIIGNIPTPLYKHLKKLLNINPKTRISFCQLFNRVKKTYPEYFPEQPKLKFQKIFTHYMKVDQKKKFYLYLIAPWVERIHPKIYALSFYRFTKSVQYFREDQYLKLFQTVFYINYTTLVKNVYPSCLGIELDDAVFYQYWECSKGKFHGDNPYVYLDKMNLFRWTSNKCLLFDYFLTIFSTNPEYSSLDPYLWCAFITIIIARMHQKIPIQIEAGDEHLWVPCNEIIAIRLTKNTLRLFIGNPNICHLVNKMLEYYARLLYNKVLDNIKQYYVKHHPNFPNLIAFYDKQVEKYNCST